MFYIQKGLYKKGIDKMLEFGFTKRGTEVKDSASKKEDRAQAGALFIPWVELSDPGCSTGKATDLFRSGQPDLFSKSSDKSQESPSKGPK